MMRSNSVLTATDEALRSALVNKDSRLIYLTHGPHPLLHCSFCHPSRPLTYALYTLPTSILLPHLLHILAIGLSTSSGLTSPLSTRSRTRFLVPSLILLLIDLYLSMLYSPFPSLINQTQQPPTSLYTLLRLLRPLSLCALDALFAFYLYATTTNRFLFFPFLVDPSAATNADAATLQLQTREMVRTTNLALHSAQAKLRALNVARNTVVRDTALREREEGYWTDVRQFENGGSANEEDVDEEIYQDEEVQAAIARVYGRGGVDVPRARREAKTFVDGVTGGLEREDGA